MRFLADAGISPVLDGLFPIGNAAGTRYPLESMKLLDGNP